MQAACLARSTFYYQHQHQRQAILRAEQHSDTEAKIGAVYDEHKGPAAVLCELMNCDGTMMGRTEALSYAVQHSLPDLTIAELATYLLSAGVVVLPEQD